MDYRKVVNGDRSLQFSYRVEMLQQSSPRSGIPVILRDCIKIVIK